MRALPVLILFSLATLFVPLASRSDGAKPANFAEMVSSAETIGIPRSALQPFGYAIPFYYYHEFMKHNGFYEAAETMMDSVVFSDIEKEAFRSLMRNAEVFSGVQIVIWTVLSNHIHLVVHIPEAPEDIPDELFWKRLAAIYSSEELDGIRETMLRIPEVTPGLAGEVLFKEFRGRFLRRMHNLSEFTKLLQRFTQWFNRRHDRCGRLWDCLTARAVPECAA